MNSHSVIAPEHTQPSWPVLFLRQFLGQAIWVMFYHMTLADCIQYVKCLPVFQIYRMLAQPPPMFKMCQTWFDSCVCYPLCCLCDISCVPFLSGDDLIDYISTKKKKNLKGRKREYKYLWKPVLPYPSWDIVAWPSCLFFCSLWENGILSVSFWGCGVTSLQSALPGMGSRFLYVEN